MLAPGEKRHPDAFSSASEASFGTQSDDDRSFSLGEPSAEGLIVEQPLPWGPDIEDSRKLYPLPLFPGTMNTIGNWDWTRNEEVDFKRSVIFWVSPNFVRGMGLKTVERAADQLWKDRVRNTVKHWLNENSARGAYVLDRFPVADDVELVESAFKDADMTRLPPIVAFEVSSSESSTSIPLIIGGGIKRKGKKPT